MSCASCHNDGGQRRPGLGSDRVGRRAAKYRRSTGRGGTAHGFLHWSANFDEVQDFEGQIRTLAGGTGLMPDAAFAQGTRSQPLGDPEGGPQRGPGRARGVPGIA